MNKIKEILLSLKDKDKRRALLTEHREVVSYVFFGVCTTIVSFVTYYIARWLFPDAESVPEWLRWSYSVGAVMGKDSNTALPVLISWICSVTFAYVTNRIWVFESRAKGLKIAAEAVKFYLARVLTLFVDLLIMFLLVDLTGIAHPLYEFGAKCFSSVFVLVLNYVFSKLFVFKGKGGKR